MMKLKKKIVACRHDEDVPLEFLASSINDAGYGDKCNYFFLSKCKLDNKKCKIITYAREDK